jgi:hypothetical protein
MRKTTSITVIIATIISLCTGCFQAGKSSSRFTEEQIVQLELGNVRPLNVLNENSLTIDLEDFLTDRTLPVDELVDTISYTSLQTTEESVIGSVEKIICVDNYVFIMDAHSGQNVLIFSNDGTFIKTLPTGQGPQEIFRPIDIAVDEEQELLIVYNNWTLSFFDYRGNFIKSERLPFNFHRFRVLPDGYLFVIVDYQNIHLEGYSEMQLLITDRNFRIISAGFPYHYSGYLHYTTKDYTNSCGKKVNFAFKFSDRVYRYVDSLSVQEKYRLDFVGKGLPDEYLAKSTDEVFETNYYFFMGDYIESETHESFLINNRSKKSYRTLIFRDKASGKLKGGNIFSGGHNIYTFTAPFTAYKDEFIGVFDMYEMSRLLSELKKHEQYKEAYSYLNELFGHLEDDANPILVKYKLKKFD